MRLDFQRIPGGVEFRVVGADGPVPIAEWTAGEPPRLPDGRPARVGVLRRLVEDDTAELRKADTVFVPHAVIAALDEAERQQIGLPRSAEITLELRGIGGFHDRDFYIERRLLHPDGRPIVAPGRKGCFLTIGSQEAVLAEPLFSLWEGIDELNAHATDTEARLLAWARLKEHLPEDVEVDDVLQSVQIVLGSAFSLLPFRNEHGEPDFDPVPGRWVHRRSDDDSEERGFEEVLAPAQQRSFGQRFRGRRAVQPRYLAGDGVYVVLPRAVQRALEVVRSVQEADPGTRRRFLTRPSSFLRDALEDAREADEPTAGDDSLVDDVFFDEGLSERVKGIGVWTPKVLPWLEPSGEKWLPEDPAGILVDGEPIALTPEKASELLGAVRRAREAGEETVEFEGKPVPATEATEQALVELAEATTLSEEQDRKKAPEASTSKLALLIIDNLDQLGFRLAPRGSRTSAERLPTNLATSLLPHQQQGLLWLQQHWVSGSPGALLADDMGLGKTLQALAFLAWIREEMQNGSWPKRPVLVVAPTGLLRTWRQEHDKHLNGAGLGGLTEAFGPGLRALRTARDQAGKELATGLPSLDVLALDRSDWVMTTYESLRDYQHSFARVHWAAIVFDEAQKIKNPAAGLTDAAKAMNQDFTLTMTGTPVENRIEDLWSIVDAARPGDLGALKEFSARFRTEDSDELQTELAQLRTELTEGSRPPVMLRRLKEDHLEGLPSKAVVTHRQPMPQPQADAYSQAVEEARRGEPMLAVLQRLRAISLHPTPTSVKADDAFIGESARLEVAFRILDEIEARREKALLFLESRSIQDALSEILERRYRLPGPVRIINGTISGARRQAKVDDFQKRSGFDVMILSPRAGGVGLTLTAANHVIHLARWWNPAVEDQCTDRVYRIGQEKPVRVHNILAVHPVFGDGSFDVRLDSLIQRKRGLNRSVLAPASASEAEIRDLYRATIGVDPQPPR